jgi:hypothetical protein
LIGLCIATIPLTKDAALKQAFRQHEISISSPLGGDISYQLIGNDLIILISGNDNQHPAHQVPLLFSIQHTASKDLPEPSVDGGFSASKSLLRNQDLEIKFDANGKISSFQSHNRQFPFQTFLDSAVRFGSTRYAALRDEIDVLQDGSDGFTASVRITSKFSIDAPNLNAPRGNLVVVEKTLTLYREVPSVYVSVKMLLPEISGTADSTATTSSVRESYDLRWQDIIPVEVTLVHPEKNSFYRIWKHNFMGITSYYDLNMKEVDAKNANIDVLSSSVSDGWLGISDHHQGLLIGFNSLKAANFAFSPLKIVEIQNKPRNSWQQQVSINPFGTYYGQMLHHWTDGSGHGQVFSSQVSTTFRPTAPSFSGKTLEFDLLISPFIGSKPNVDLISRHAHYNLPPFVAIRDETGAVVMDNTEGLAAKLASISQKVGLTPAIMQMNYLEWVEHINRTQPETPKKGGGIPPLKIKTILNLIADSIRAKKPKRLI